MDGPGEAQVSVGTCKPPRTKKNVSSLDSLPYPLPQRSKRDVAGGPQRLAAPR